MDPNPPLDQTMLVRYLNTVLLALAEAHTKTGDLTAKTVDKQLPSELFMTAVIAKWIEDAE
jgi:hypothetical protein